MRLPLPQKVFSIKYLVLSILFALILSAVYGLLTTAKAHAQEFDKYLPAYNQYAVPETNPDVPQNLHSYTQSVTIEFMASFICQIAGVDPTREDRKCLGIDPKTGKIGFVENGGGAIGITTNLIAMTFTPPASSGDYVRYLAGNFGIAKNAYAAEDQGLSGLAPLQPIWTAMRNVAYIFFV